MAWRDELRPASFRGVPFYVDGSELSIGRRLARHEYPQRDIPYLEDMGRKARDYKLPAYVLGDDYMSARDKLIKALETAGPGQLVHPYFGLVSVKVVGDVQISESTREGGIARFSIPFVESGEQAEPASSTDTAAVLSDTQDAIETACSADFAKKFSIDGAPDFVVADALKNVSGVFDLPGFDLGNLAWLRADPLSTLKGLLPENLLSSMANPLNLALGLASLLRRVTNLTAMFDYAGQMQTSARSGNTPSRLAQQANQSALGNVLLQFSTANRIVSLANAVPVTTEDARAARAEIVSRTDDVLFSSGIGQKSADAMVQLRTDALQALTANSVDLPRLVDITNQVNLPAIVVAHDFYGDSWSTGGLADDLVARNKIRNPGFVPAGQVLKLISE